MPSSRSLPPAPSGRGRTSTWRAPAALLAGALLLVGLPGQDALAGTSGEPGVPLGAAQTYAVLGDSVTNTGATVVHGDLGVSASGGPIGGFPPGLVIGSTVNGDAAAHDAIVAAITNAAGRTPNDHLAGDQNGVTLLPGVHAFGAAFGLTGTLTLDAGGDPTAVFVFQINGALNTAAASTVTLVKGAQAANVFWESVGAANTGANSSFAGTILSGGAITLGAGTSLVGRALTSSGAVTLADDQINVPAPVVGLTIDGGPAVTVTSTPHPFTGTASNANGATVTLTVDGQTLHAIVQGDGTWSVTSPVLRNGTYPVTASVSVSELVGATAAQVLTVDATLPVVTIDGGAAVTTGLRSPLLAGTSTTAPGSLVTVTVAGQDLTATVTPGGRWSVTPAPLGDGPHPVVATAADPAGNQGTAQQQLTVDATAPVIAIDGGPAVTTPDSAPLVSGTTDAAPGSVVTVVVDGAPLTTTVQPGGLWSVRSAALADGTYAVTVSVANPDGVVGSAAQLLTVAARTPVITIDGGPTVFTYSTSPTITGTTDAPANTVVSVRVDGRLLTALVSEVGTWRVTAAALPVGAYGVTASDTNKEDRTGSASQFLTVVAPVVLTPFTVPPVTIVVPVVVPAPYVAPAVTVAAAVTEPALPFTGFDLGTGWYGLAALLLGGLLVTVGRIRPGARRGNRG